MIISTKKNPEQAQASNRILIGTEINGNFTSNGDLRIDGKLVGVIKLEGKLVIGENGVVDGEIFCKNATVAGKLKGKTEVAELTTLLASATVEGELYTGKLSVEPGAEFNGTCSMGAVVRKMSDKKEEKTKSA
jgi:cytoskeletal protein CcmA (bactofilin family)